VGKNVKSPHAATLDLLLFGRTFGGPTFATLAHCREGARRAAADGRRVRTLPAPHQAH
jgi:hypothetical protein